MAPSASTMDDFDRWHQELIAQLDELVRLLRDHDEHRWADWLEHDRKGLAAFDHEAIDHLLSAYGGMGSFSDLLIDPSNGHSIVMASAEGVNKTLSALRSAVFELATDLRRARDRPSG